MPRRPPASSRRTRDRQRVAARGLPGPLRTRWAGAAAPPPDLPLPPWGPHRAGWPGDRAAIPPPLRERGGKLSAAAQRAWLGEEGWGKLGWSGRGLGEAPPQAAAAGGHLAARRGASRRGGRSIRLGRITGTRGSGGGEEGEGNTSSLETSCRMSRLEQDGEGIRR